MFKSISSLTKAALSVAVSPITIVMDIVTLPSTAYDNKHPFGNTKAVFNNAGKLVKETIGITDVPT